MVASCVGKRGPMGLAINKHKRYFFNVSQGSSGVKAGPTGPCRYASAGALRVQPQSSNST